MKNREGQWNREHYVNGPDSSLHGDIHNNNSKTKRMHHITMASVLIPKPEPVYRQTTVDVELTRGGRHTHVAWPGGQVNASPSGIPSPVSLQVHGLWEAPLPGQKVLIGYSNGDCGDPVVINKYSYNALQNPIFEAAHNLPMTQKAHGPLDVVLGHFTGSYIALRGTLPLPGHIEMNSLATINIESLVSTTVKSLSVKLETLSSATVELKSTGLISISNPADDLKSILSDLISVIKGLITIGNPVTQTTSQATQTLLTAIDTRLALLLSS